MLNIVLNTASAFFDIFLIHIYFSKMFTERRPYINKIVYCSCLVGMELIVNIMMLLRDYLYEPLRIPSTIEVSILTLFILTYVYEGSFAHRLFVTITFQVYCNLSEFILFLMISNTIQYDYIYNFLSKIIDFLLVIITLLLTNKKKTNFNISYNMLILTTPIVTFVSIMSMSLTVSDTPSFEALKTVGIIGLLFLNISNFYLLDNIIKSKELRFKEQNLIQQIEYQADKYNLISTAYRETRKLIHDTKQHLFFIRSSVENREYDIIPEYINRQIEELETKHIIVNCGNLVIDSLVSNYIQIARKESITFSTNIHIIPNDIPVANYDLCVIIGNLLENSIHASQKIPSSNDRRIIFEAFTSETEFIIHVNNNITGDNIASLTAKTPSLNHGYGIQNIKNMVTRYTGVYNSFVENNTYNTIIVIPIKTTTIELS